jgi:hypothetical protein
LKDNKTIDKRSQKNLIEALHSKKSLIDFSGNSYIDMNNLHSNSSKKLLMVSNQLNTVFLKTKKKPVKKIKRAENNNSVLAKYRENLERNKNLIDEELSKAREVEVLYSSIYKSFRKSEEKRRLANFKISKNLESKNNIQNSNSSYKSSKNVNLNSGWSNESDAKNNTSYINSKKLNYNQSGLFKTGISDYETSMNTTNKKFKMTNYKEAGKKLSNLVLPKRTNLHSEKRYYLTNSNEKNKTESSRQNNSEDQKPNIPNKITSMYKNHSRIRTFNVEYITNWYESSGFSSPIFSYVLLNNVEYQSKIIIDDIKVLIENLQFYKLNYLSSEDLLSMFKNITLKRQVEYNKLLEETSGLLFDISHVILLDFSNYLEKFLSVNPPNKPKDCKIKQEEDAFINNCRFLSENFIFFKSCFDVYCILIKSVDDMIIPYKTFVKLMQFLARARYNVSCLIMTSKNAIKNLQFDENNLDKMKTKLKIKNSDENLAETMSVKHKIDNKWRSNENPIISQLDYKIRRDFTFKINEDNQRMSRLNGVLNSKNRLYQNDGETSFEKKKRKNREIKKEKHKSILVIKKIYYNFFFKI